MTRAYEAGPPRFELKVATPKIRVWWSPDELKYERNLDGLWMPCKLDEIPYDDYSEVIVFVRRFMPDLPLNWIRHENRTASGRRR